MQSDNLSAVGGKLVRKYGTRNPFELADCLGIIIKECPDFGPLKGMYTVIKRNRFIFLNNTLDNDMKRIVCAHEIGHDQLHRDIVRRSAMQEFTLYDMTSRPEYEANVVCSEILLDTDEFLTHIYEEHHTAKEIAGIMHTDINLVALKADYLSSLGYELNSLGFQSDFLK